MNLQPLKRDQLREAAKTVAVAFFNYPQMRTYFPNEGHRRYWTPWYMTNVLRTAFLYGKVTVTEDLSGVIFVLPPKNNAISIWQYIRGGFFLSPYILGLRNYFRSMACESYADKVRHGEMRQKPYLYLWGLAVDPQRKASGLGKALIAQLLDSADPDRLPIYLETHDKANLAYYERFSFKLRKSEIVPKVNLPFWTMVRAPG